LTGLTAVIDSFAADVRITPASGHVRCN
jgi:hypothetical protein